MMGIGEQDPRTWHHSTFFDKSFCDCPETMTEEKAPREFYVHPYRSPYHSQIFNESDFEPGTSAEFKAECILMIEKSAYQQMRERAETYIDLHSKLQFEYAKLECRAIELREALTKIRERAELAKAKLKLAGIVCEGKIKPKKKTPKPEPDYKGLWVED